MILGDSSQREQGDNDVTPEPESIIVTLAPMKPTRRVYLHATKKLHCGAQVGGEGLAIV
jgi:hypothetical protein